MINGAAELMTVLARGRVDPHAADRIGDGLGRRRGLMAALMLMFAH